MSDLPTTGTATRTAARTGWLAAATIVVGVFVAIGVLGEALAPAPQGQPSSSYATASAGVAAWAQLLQRAGHPVRRLRIPVAQASLSATSTLVVLGARALSASDRTGMRRFVRAGGILVLGGGDLAATLPALLADPPPWTPTGTRSVRALRAAPELTGVQTVRSASEGSFTGTGPGALLGDPPVGTLLLVRTLGRGRIDLLADASPVQNRLLASADNAQLSLDLAGGDRRAVVFDESIHGFTAATGLAALPDRWWLAFGGLALAGVAWALARGRRLGPAEPELEAPAPARSAYVEAIAAALSRTHDPEAIAELVRIPAARGHAVVHDRQP